MVVREINDITKLEQTPMFKVDKLLWGTKECPKTYGYLGYKKKDGFYLRMICEEKNPCRSYKKNMDPVYKDSAMEAFFQFFPKSMNETPIYLNFEVNANGALLAECGPDRENRICLQEDELSQTHCKVVIEEKFWKWDLRLPETLLHKIYGSFELENEFRCNFYKISENPQIEHYASYSAIKTERPNFHEPSYFAKAVIK